MSLCLDAAVSACSWFRRNQRYEKQRQQHGEEQALAFDCGGIPHSFRPSLALHQHIPSSLAFRCSDSIGSYLDSCKLSIPFERHSSKTEDSSTREITFKPMAEQYIRSMACTTGSARTSLTGLCSKISTAMLPGTWSIGIMSVLFSPSSQRATWARTASWRGQKSCTMA